MIILCDMINNVEDLSKFERIYESYKNTLYAVAFDIVKNHHDAEDIVEESLIKVIGILSDIEGEMIGTPRCKNLMITIAKHQAIDYWRKQKRLPIPTDELPNSKEDQNVEELYINLENYRELLKCLDELDEKYRDVLKLKILYDLTSKKIADILNITESNVNVRFMRAKKILAKRLRERECNE